MQTVDYHSAFFEIFGSSISRDLRVNKLHSVYPEGSKFFKKCHEALLAVEHECIGELIHDLNDRNVQGVFAEFGIYQGAWIERLFQMTEYVGLRDRQIYGFDSFQGLSPPHKLHDTPYWKEGMYAASKEDVEQLLRVHERSRIKLIEGFFSYSLGQKEALEIEKVAFARIDCDIYEPAKECLNYLSSRLSNNAILVFDDWTHDFDYGEGRAFKEWVPTVPHLSFEFLFLGPWDHFHIRVTHK